MKKLWLLIVFATVMAVSAHAQTVSPKDYGFDVKFGGTPTVAVAENGAKFQYVTSDYPANGFNERVTVVVAETAPKPEDVFKGIEEYLLKFDTIDEKQVGKWEGNPAEWLSLTHIKNGDKEFDGMPAMALVVVKDKRAYLVFFAAVADSTTAGNEVGKFFDSFSVN